MKSTVEQLSPADRKALALWYDSNSYNAFRRLIDIERIELAKDAIDQIDIKQVRYISGQAASLKRLVGTLRQIYKESNEDKKS